MIICTIAARNYLSHVRVLAESVRRHNPEQRIAVLLIDDARRQVVAEPDFEVLRADELTGLPSRELARMAMIYDLLELATAVKPWLLEHLLAEHEQVVYLDPDILVTAPLDFLGPLIDEHQLVLTPHVTRPVPDDGRTPSQLDIMATGVFNLGFVGIGPGAAHFLDYWKARLRRQCIDDRPRQLFVDQRWIDFAAGYFHHHILRDETCNVAYWNVDSRTIAHTAQGFTANDQPLTFFHFSGYELDRPAVLSRHHGKAPRVLLHEHADLRRLCDEYAARLRARGYQIDVHTVYAYGTSSGVTIDVPMRRAYRDALEIAEARGGEEPPIPFVDGMAAFVEWLRAPAGGGLLPAITRYMKGIWLARSDVRSRCYDLRQQAHVDAFLAWMRERGQRELAIPDILMPPDTAADQLPLARGATPADTGVNVVGYLSGVLGVGEAARALVSALGAADEPCTTLALDPHTPWQQRIDSAMAANARFDVNVLVLNADGTLALADHPGGELLRDRYTVGMWAWETPELPAAMRAALEHVDEVWMGSDFARDAVAPHTDKPVLTFPLPVLRPRPAPGVTRASLGLPGERFVFLFCFDFLSVMERKNPIGLVRAFCRAFAPDEGPVLVIKSINGERRPAARARLMEAVTGRGDVLVVDRCLSGGERSALMALTDAYVSLHRSEGFGLTMAEAMALGKPVMATGWSGNLEYMTEANSYLVRHKLAEVGPGCEPYPADHLWAEPDLDHAAVLLRRIFDQPEDAQQRGDLAARDIARYHSPEARAVFLVHRLHEIRRARAQRCEPLTVDAPRRTRGAAMVRAMRQARDQVQLALRQRRAADGVAGVDQQTRLDRRLRVIEERLEAVESPAMVPAPSPSPNGNGNGNGNGNSHAAVELTKTTRPRQQGAEEQRRAK